MEYIYCYTNKLNNHKYVGQTNNIKRRQNEHWSNANNPNSLEFNLLFHQKLRQYGKENFSFSILEEIDSDNLELINNKEIYWIEKMQSYAGYGQGGYNLTLGGDNMEHNRIYDLKTIKEIKEKIKLGISYNDIVQEYKISIGYISGINTGLYFYDSNETYPLHKYYQTKDDLNSVINLLQNTTIPMTEIAKIVNKSYSTIKKINSGTLWHNDSTNYPIRKINKTDEKANKIKEYLLDGYTTSSIVDLLNVSRQTVERINKGQTHYDSTLEYPLRKPVSTI